MFLSSDSQAVGRNLVSREIVHEQNIAGLDSWDDTLFNIAIEHGAIDRARQHQGSIDPRPANDRQGRGLGSRGLWHAVDHTLTRRRSPIQTGPTNID